MPIPVATRGAAPAAQPAGAPVANIGLPTYQGYNPGAAVGGGIGGLQAALSGGYQSALNYNNQLAQTINQGYGQVRQQQANQLRNIAGAYDTLGTKVQQTIAGTDAAAKQQIADQYAQQMGSAQNAMVNSGLGNSTVTQAVNRGLTLDESKAYTNLADQMAQLQAGYMSNIGLAGLGFRGQAVGMNSQLAQNQLGWMNSISAPYPDTGMYMNAAQNIMGQQQAERDRQLMMKKYGGMGGGFPVASGGASGGGSSGGGALGHSIGNYGATGASPYGGGGSYYGDLMMGKGSLGGAVPGWGPTGSGGFGNAPTEYGYAGAWSPQGSPEGAGQGTGEGGPMPEDPYGNWGVTGVSDFGGGAFFPSYGGGGEF